MHNQIAPWIIAAVSFVALGIAVFAAGMSLNRWDFQTLSTASYETSTYEITEDFRDISVKTDTADITFAASEDGKSKVVLYEDAAAKHTVSAEGGVLSVHEQRSKKWYENIGFNFHKPHITVYLPHADYGLLHIEEHTGDISIPQAFSFEAMDITATTGDVEILSSVSGAAAVRTNTGCIRAKGISAGSLSLSVSTGHVTAERITCSEELDIAVSTGDVQLTDITCQALKSAGNTGDIALQNVVAAESFSLERSTGNVTFDGCDAGEIFVTTDTGHVRGTLLTEKVFLAQTDTGRVSVPKTAAGGRCEVTTDTGDILLEIK